LRYKQQRNKVNNLKRNAKENSEKNLDTIILENASNSKEYWKLMKMLIKSNKPSYNLPPLNNIVDDIEANIVYDDNGKCDLFNKYFSCISGIDDESLFLTVTQFVGIHSLAIRTSVSVKVLHISSTSFKLPRSAFQSALSNLCLNVSSSIRSYNKISLLNELVVQLGHSIYATAAS
jgi:hypothetical protein